MLTIEEIKIKYGHMVSFAIWQKIDKTQKPKFGMGDISHFDNIEKLNIKSFEIELKDIGAKNPIIIAFGNDCFKILNELKEKFGFTYIFISHDLSVVKYMSDQLIVMNKGEIEEKGDADKIYANPEKSYTKKLINAIPKGL